MKFSVIILSKILFVLFFSEATIHPGSKFLPEYIKTLDECKRFVQSKYDVARVSAYYDYKGNMFFIDQKKRLSLQKCAHAFDLHQTKIAKTIIFVVNDSEYNNTNLLDAINNVRVWADDLGVIMVPQIRIFLGPGGSCNELAKGLVEEDLRGSVLFAASEVESMNRPYTQEFFANLQAIDNFVGTSNKYLLLNGWHLREMRTRPSLSFKTDLNLIIVTVGKSNAHRISIVEALQNTPLNFTIVVDMPFSPVKMGGRRLEFNLKLVGLVMAINFIGKRI